MPDEEIVIGKEVAPGVYLTDYKVSITRKPLRCYIGWHTWIEWDAFVDICMYCGKDRFR